MGNIELSYDADAEADLLRLLGPIVSQIIASDEDVTEIFVRPSWMGVERLSLGFCAIDGRESVQVVAVLRMLASFSAIDLSLASPRIQISLKIGPNRTRVRFTGLYAGPAGADSLLTIRIPRILKVPLIEAVTIYDFGQERTRILIESLLTTGGILIAGGVGSGKTTFLRSIAQHIIDNNTNGDDNIVIVEDTPELCIDEQPFVTAIEATQWLSFRDCCKDMLRHRPTRGFVGEVRGGEALDAVKVGTTGAGLYLTIHASTAYGAIRILKSRMAEGQREGEYVDPALILDAFQFVLVLGRRKGKFVVREFCKLTSITDTEIELKEVC